MQYCGVPIRQTARNTMISVPSAPTGRRVRERQEWERVAASLQDFSAARSTLYYRRREIALIERWPGPVAGRKVLKLDLWNEAFNTPILHSIPPQAAQVPPPAATPP